MINVCFGKNKTILALKIKYLVILTLNKIVGLFDFSDLNKFLFVLSDLLPFINLTYSVILTNISKYSDKFVFFNIDISGLSILLNF